MKGPLWFKLNHNDKFLTMNIKKRSKSLKMNKIGRIRFLHDEMEYLKSVKRINMKTVNKYQIFAKNKDYLLNILI